MLANPDKLVYKDLNPIPTLVLPVVFEYKALFPKPTLVAPVVLDNPVLLPIKLLLVESLKESLFVIVTTSVNVFSPAILWSPVNFTQLSRAEVRPVISVIDKTITPVLPATLNTLSVLSILAQPVAVFTAQSFISQSVIPPTSVVPGYETIQK